MNSAMRDVSLYFAIVIVLSAPIWVLGSAAEFQLLPGLPLSALAVICPTLAAVAISYRTGGKRAMLGILARGFDAGKAGWRLIPVAVVNPVLFGLALLASRFLGTDVPNPQFTVLDVLVLTALFLPAALLEEIGWTSYALDRLQTCYGPLAASLVLGLFWAVWHYPALLQAGRSIDWIAWWSLWTVSARVVMVWIYNNTGASVFAVTLYHVMSNLCWQLYPVSGSYFDPRISGLITFVLAVVLTTWSPITHPRRH
jgi:hypothetical protein